MSGRHTFNIKLTATHVFEMVIENFNQSLAWVLKLKIKKIKFVAILKGLLKLVSTLKIKKIKFTINNNLVELLSRIISNVKIKKIKFSVIVSGLENIIQTLSIKRIKFTILLRQLLSVVDGFIKINKITVSASATVAVFYTLSYFDPYYLSDLDDMYLSDMDFVV
jgi:hypothetical protein